MTDGQFIALCAVVGMVGGLIFSRLGTIVDLLRKLLEKR